MHCFFITSPLNAQSVILDNCRFEAFVPQERHLAESSSKRVQRLDVLVRGRVTESDVKLLTLAGLEFVSRTVARELKSQIVESQQ
jgi:hypothetical protein